MGQKINPISFRLAVNKDWRSKWYATGTDYTDKLHEDLKIRKYLKTRLHMSGVAKVVIERAWNSVRVTLSTARPGLVIGRKGSEIEKLTNSSKGIKRFIMCYLVMDIFTEKNHDSLSSLVRLCNWWTES